MKKAKSRVLALNGYAEFLGELKQRIMSARVSAARVVNNELILLYWDIGRAIVEKQQLLNWGFSTRNLWDMRRLFEAYGSSEFLRQAVAELPKRDRTSLRTPIWLQPVAKLKGTDAACVEPQVDAFLRQVVAEIPWGHHLLILNKISDPAARLYYLQATAQFGWSRSVLLNQIKAKAYERARREKKTHNFAIAAGVQRQAAYGQRASHGFAT